MWSKSTRVPNPLHLLLSIAQYYIGDGEGGSKVESESDVGQGDASSPASSSPPSPPAPATPGGCAGPHLLGTCFNPVTGPSTTCQHLPVRPLQWGGGSAASWENLSRVGYCHFLVVVFFNALVGERYHMKKIYKKYFFVSGIGKKWSTSKSQCE